MNVIEIDEAPSVERKHNQIILRVRPGADEKKKQAVIEEWYRRQLKHSVAPLIGT